MSGHDLTADYDKPVTHADLAAVVTEQEQLRAENQQLRDVVNLALMHLEDERAISSVRAALARVEKSE